MNIPQLVKEKILEIDKNAEVILFGSRARGDFHKESDWDFLVLSDKEATPEFKDLIRDNIFDLEIETLEVFGTIIKNKIDWKKYANSRLFKNISRDGVKL